MAQNLIKHPNKQLRRRLQCLQNKVHEYAQLKIQGKRMDVLLVVRNPQTQELYSYRSRADFPLADLETMLEHPNARNRFPEDVDRVRSRNTRATAASARGRAVKQQARHRLDAFPYPPTFGKKGEPAGEELHGGGQSLLPEPPQLRVQKSAGVR